MLWALFLWASGKLGFLSNLFALRLRKMCSWQKTGRKCPGFEHIFIIYYQSLKFDCRSPSFRAQLTGTVLSDLGSWQNGYQTWDWSYPVILRSSVRITRSPPSELAPSFFKKGFFCVFSLLVNPLRDTFKYRSTDWPFLTLSLWIFFFFNLKNYWSIVDFQYCVHFRCTTKWISYIATLFLGSFSICPLGSIG